MGTLQPRRFLALLVPFDLVLNHEEFKQVMEGSGATNLVANGCQ
jgi:hypothetical protein